MSPTQVGLPRSPRRPSRPRRRISANEQALLRFRGGADRDGVSCRKCGFTTAPSGAIRHPYNFDYAMALFDCLHYATVLTVPPIGNAPFFWPFQKGVPNQVAKAGINAVTVIPCNSFEHDFGVLDNTELTGELLKELQAFIFFRRGSRTYRTGLAIR